MVKTMHTWKRVYVIHGIHAKSNTGEKIAWNTIMGLRDDGRVYYQNYDSAETYAAAETRFRPGESSLLSDETGPGWVTDEGPFVEHCASLAALTESKSMHERPDLCAEAVDEKEGEDKDNEANPSGHAN